MADENKKQEQPKEVSEKQAFDSERTHHGHETLKAGYRYYYKTVPTSNGEGDVETIRVVEKV